MIPFLLQTQCSACNHFFKLSRTKLLWPALRLKVKGQKSLIFVLGLHLVWCKWLRSLRTCPQPVGQPSGNFHFTLFAQTIVTQLVAKFAAQAVTSPKLKKQYKKWEHQQMAIDINEEKGSNHMPVSVLHELFPKVKGSLLESHPILDPSVIKQRTENRGARAGRKHLVTSASTTLHGCTTRYTISLYGTPPHPLPHSTAHRVYYTVRHQPLWNTPSPSPTALHTGCTTQYPASLYGTPTQVQVG